VAKQLQRCQWLLGGHQGTGALLGNHAADVQR